MDLAAAAQLGPVTARDDPVISRQEPSRGGHIAPGDNGKRAICGVLQPFKQRDQRIGNGDPMRRLGQINKRAVKVQKHRRRRQIDRRQIGGIQGRDGLRRGHIKAPARRVGRAARVRPRERT